MKKIILKNIVNKGILYYRKSKIFRVLLEYVCVVGLRLLTLLNFGRLRKRLSVPLAFLSIGSLNFSRLSYLLPEIYKHEKHDQSSDTFRRMMLALGEVCAWNPTPELVFSILEKHVQRYSNDFWCWRLILDLGYFSSRNDIVERNYKSFQITQNLVKEKYGLSKNKLYFSDYTLSSIGHSFHLIENCIRKIVYNEDRDIRDVIIVNRHCGKNSFIIEQFSSDYHITSWDEIGVTNNSDRRFIEHSFLYVFKVNGVYRDFFDYRTKMHAVWQACSSSKKLNLPTGTLEYGRQCLKALGISPCAFIVVVHAKQTPQKEERDTDIATYYRAIKTITEVGGVVFRIGDELMPRMPSISGVYDLAHSRKFTALFDMYLLATAKFAIVCQSGPCEWPYIYGVPRIYTNPLIIRHVSVLPSDILLPVIFYDESVRRKLRLAEVLNSNLSRSHLPIRINPNLKPIYNTESDIYDGVLEMLQDLKIISRGSNVYNDDQELIMREVRRDFDSAGLPFLGKIGRRIIRMHPEVFSRAQ